MNSPIARHPEALTKQVLLAAEMNSYQTRVILSAAEALRSGVEESLSISEGGAGSAHWQAGKQIRTNRLEAITPHLHSSPVKTILLLASAFLLATLVPSPAAEKKLIVGMELAYPPFEMRDERGEPAGVSVDLARALAAYLGQPVEIENIPFDGLIPALKTGRIDVIISSMTATPERAQSIDFSEPYLKTGLCLLVGSKTDIQAIADADKPGRTIAVKKGTTGHIYAAQNLKAARPLVLDKETACVLEVAQGKAEAFIYDQMSTYQNWRKNPETTRAILTPFQQETWAVGLRKGDNDLRAKVNAFITGYRGSRGFEKLGDKWLAEQKAEFKKLGIPFYF
jgi:polar amino acid transport system substrate-binding protein